MSAETFTTAYVGGENAKFFIHINNESSSDVVASVLELIRTVNYNSDDPKQKTKIKNESLKSARFEGVAAKSTKQINAFLTIPSVAPTSDTSCRVLQISYGINITALMSGLHSHLTVNLPIIIGTIPYMKIDEPLELDNIMIEPSTSTSTSSGQEQVPNIRSIFSRDSIGWNLGPSTSSVSMPRPSAPAPNSPEDYDMRKFFFLKFAFN